MILNGTLKSETPVGPNNLANATAVWGFTKSIYDHRHTKSQLRFFRTLEYLYYNIRISFTERGPWAVTPCMIKVEGTPVTNIFACIKRIQNWCNFLGKCAVLLGTGIIPRAPKSQCSSTFKMFKSQNHQQILFHWRYLENGTLGRKCGQSPLDCVV